uniref:FAD-dependent oxidoreductase domain-containing protein 1 n=1 Tax=Anas platyrhynchos platyrhynchos TaxID=8840 RepID=A0A493TDZ0_ANAPP
QPRAAARRLCHRRHCRRRLERGAAGHGHRQSARGVPSPPPHPAQEEVRLHVALPRWAGPGVPLPHRHLGGLFSARGHRWQLPRGHEPPRGASQDAGSVGFFWGAGGHPSDVSPVQGDEPDTGDLEVDHDFFQEQVWPRLAHRVPPFQTLKVRSSWAGYYDYNTFDQNGVLGRHPQLQNVFVVGGFSGHGLQQAPAAGRAAAELLLHGRCSTMDVGRLAPGRLLHGEPLREAAIV